MEIDSIKLKMQVETLDFNKSDFDKQTLEKRQTSSLDNSDRVSTKFVLQDACTGISRIEILPQTSEIIVQASAKVLQEEYLKGISLNTIERFHRNLNPFIKCSVNDIANAHTLKVDITKNCYFNSREEKENAIYSTKLCKSNIAFKVDDYTDKKESIVFTGRQATYKNRQIYYNKEKELNLKHNEWIKFILESNNTKDIDKILRVEQNITNIAQIRKAIKQEKGQVKLIDILKSKENPILKRHKIISKYADKINLFDEYDNWKDAMFIEGIEGLYKKCNSSLEVLIDFYEKKYTQGEIKKRGPSFYETRKKIINHFNVSYDSNNIVRNSTKKSSQSKHLNALKNIELLLKSA